jgi:hypothetical protein
MMTTIKRVTWQDTTYEDSLGSENYSENYSEEDELLLYIKHQNNIIDEENRLRKLGIEGSRIFRKAINLR